MTIATVCTTRRPSSHSISLEAKYTTLPRVGQAGESGLTAQTNRKGGNTSYADLARRKTQLTHAPLEVADPCRGHDLVHRFERPAPRTRRPAHRAGRRREG